MVRRRGRRLDPFILVLEGSVPNEQLSGDGHWAAFGVDPTGAADHDLHAGSTGSRRTPAAVMALGTCAAYGGIPAMRNNPTGAMGLRDYLGAGWSSRRGIPIVNLPGCPVQPDNITETLMQRRAAPRRRRARARPRRPGPPALAVRAHRAEGCGRAGFAEQGEFARTPGRRRGCLVKLGCRGPVVKCNVPIRGWINGIGGCPNVGGICMACTMPGFPDKFMPFMDPNRLGLLAARGAQFTYGPVVRRLRGRAIRRR